MPVLRCLHLRMFYNHFLGKKFVEAKVTDIAASKDNTGVSSCFRFLILLSYLWISFYELHGRSPTWILMARLPCGSMFVFVKSRYDQCLASPIWSWPKLKGYEKHYQAFIWQSSGSYQAVVGQSLGSHKVINLQVLSFLTQPFRLKSFSLFLYT